MAVVSMLFLMTSIVHHTEGPYFSGIINTLRVLGTLIGGALVGHLLVIRGNFHTEMLIEHSTSSNTVFSELSVAGLGQAIAQQSMTLSVADIYRIFGVAACLLIPLVLRMTHIPAPSAQSNSN